MKDLIAEIIDPKILSSIEGLELTAKIIVEGYFSGFNQSKQVGIGHEFSQYRSYQPGDDLRLMDWKMYARSERYYVRQSEIETNINIKFIIDASNSMLHQDGAFTKLDFARMMAASLAYLAKNQGDTYGILWANDAEVQELHGQYNQLHYQRFLYHLLQIKPQGGWLKDYEKLGRFYDPRNREVIIFITDMYDFENDLTDFVKKLKNNRNEVIVFHLMGANELDHSYRKEGLYEDLETGEQVRLEPRQGSEENQREIETSLSAIREDMLNANIGYELFRMDTAIDVAISSFIKKRNQLI